MKRYHRRLGWPSLLLLLLAARGDGCGFSLDQRGLCAHLRIGPEDHQLRVGSTFRVQVNADGCSSATGCPCQDGALDQARWTSGDPAVASVDSSGLVLGRAPGTALISVTPATGEWSRTRIQVTVTP